MHITNEKNDIERVLFSEKEIQNRVKEIGAELTEEYKDKNPCVVCILKGASFFYTDLCREIKTNIYMDFIAVSSYGLNSKTSGVVRIIKDLDKNILDRDVIIVEDIIDSGLTIHYLRNLFSSRSPRSIKTVCLLKKMENTDNKNDVKADVCGFLIPNVFVVGYGLDYADYYRNLPYIGILKPECYQS